MPERPPTQALRHERVRRALSVSGLLLPIVAGVLGGRNLLLRTCGDELMVVPPSELEPGWQSCPEVGRIDFTTWPSSIPEQPRTCSQSNHDAMRDCTTSFGPLTARLRFSSLHGGPSGYRNVALSLPESCGAGTELLPEGGILTGPPVLVARRCPGVSLYVVSLLYVDPHPHGGVTELEPVAFRPTAPTFPRRPAGRGLVLLLGIAAWWVAGGLYRVGAVRAPARLPLAPWASSRNGVDVALLVLSILCSALVIVGTLSQN